MGRISAVNITNLQAFRKFFFCKEIGLFIGNHPATGRFGVCRARCASARGETKQRDFTALVSLRAFILNISRGGGQKIPQTGIGLNPCRTNGLPRGYRATMLTLSDNSSAHSAGFARPAIRRPGFLARGPAERAAAKQMQMNMKHRLPRTAIAIPDQPVAVFGHAFIRG